MMATRAVPRRNKAFARHDPRALNWQEYAACGDVEDKDAFYPDTEDPDPPKPEVVQELCPTCPVREACALYAIEHDYGWGFWGGLSPAERGHARAGRRRAAAEEVAA